MPKCGICDVEFESPFVRTKYCSVVCRKKRKANAFIAQRQRLTKLIGATKCMVCTGCSKPIIARGKCYACAVSVDHVIQPASWRFVDAEAKEFRAYASLKRSA